MKKIVFLFGGIALIVLLYILSRLDFLFFHILIESVSFIIIPFLVYFIYTSDLEDRFFERLAPGLISSFVLILFHTASYKGMNIISGDEANITAQF